MKEKEIYLSFPTDRETALKLKIIAQKMGKTQPELINEICKNFIDELEAYIAEKIEEENKNG